jgi:hypothetical protein
MHVTAKCQSNFTSVWLESRLDARVEGEYSRFT